MGMNISQCYKEYVSLTWHGILLPSKEPIEWEYIEFDIIESQINPNLVTLSRCIDMALSLVVLVILKQLFISEGIAINMQTTIARPSLVSGTSVKND